MPAVTSDTDINGKVSAWFDAMRSGTPARGQGASPTRLVAQVEAALGQGGTDDEQEVMSLRSQGLPGPGIVERTGLPPALVWAIARLPMMTPDDHEEYERAVKAYHDGQLAKSEASIFDRMVPHLTAAPEEDMQAILAEALPTRTPGPELTRPDAGRGAEGGDPVSEQPKPQPPVEPSRPSMFDRLAESLRP
jgi:hypothetical protein